MQYKYKITKLFPKWLHQNCYDRHNLHQSTCMCIYTNIYKHMYIYMAYTHWTQIFPYYSYLQRTVVCYVQLNLQNIHNAKVIMHHYDLNASIHEL